MFEWDRLRALCDIRGDRQGGIGSLALYHPPFDADDPKAAGEDCIFVGPTLSSLSTPALWEYIRLYMEEGPTVNQIPANAPPVPAAQRASSKRRGDPGGCDVFSMGVGKVRTQVFEWRFLWFSSDGGPESGNIAPSKAAVPLKRGHKAELPDDGGHVK